MTPEFDYSLLFLVTPILGFTAALISMFPRLLGAIKPFVALGVAVVLYFFYRSLDASLLGLLVATGSAMGLYELRAKGK